MKTKQSLLSVIGATLALLSATCISAFAQANTVPAGYFTVNIAAGTGTSPTLSVISFPLLGTANITGQAVGIITGVTSNTISNSNAGWTAGQLSTPATPCLIQITSGTAAGRIFLISTTTANTSTTATIDPTDASLTNLTTLGININTDTYQIIPADTLSSVFGTPATTGILGGTSASQADQVQLLSGAGWVSYYYNTNSAAWLRVGPPIPSNTVVIRPDAAVLYSRLANTALTLTVMGQVPAIARQTIVNNSSISFLSANWPVNLTLATSNIQNTPGWVANSTSAGSDVVQLLTSTGWLQYYYNGSHWMRVGPPILSDSVAINAGSGFLIVKQGSATGASVLSQSIPYSF